MPSSITVSDLRTLTSPQLVDVRSPSEFAAGHIPGTVNIPMDQIEGRLNDLHAGARVVLVCQAGKRARMTADLLASTHHDIAVLEGGTNAWRRSGLPLVCCIKTRWSLERQVRLIAGLIILGGLLLAVTFNRAWILLSGLVGLGLTFAGLTDICPMGILLQKMPWNRKAHCNPALPIVETLHER